MVTNWIAIIAVGIFSIVWVELIRDFYHALSHHWKPLYRLHVWHHRVFRPDLSPVSTAIYKQAHWYNDVPESLVMLGFSFLPWLVVYFYFPQYQGLAWAGSGYTLSFLISAIARGTGLAYADELTDLTHRPGPFDANPSHWFVNRSYHWRHHFDNQKAYYSGTLTLVDKLMGTALSLKGKKIAITGASGTLGKALIKELRKKEAKVTALTSKENTVTLYENGQHCPIKTLNWQVGKETELSATLEDIDILILNHGINVGGERTAEAIAKSYEINAFSSWRLLELFLTTVHSNEDIATKEVWVNTSEAEVSPAFSPLYELSKRTLGDLVTLRRLDAPCTVRKLILGPFKSNLNPIGIMSSEKVAQQIINLAQRDFLNIIVTINPLTWLAFPCKELAVSTYFNLFSKKRNNAIDSLPKIATGDEGLT